VNGITGLGAIRNLDYTVLLCDDLVAMRRFYTEVMGFEVGHEIPDIWVALQVGASLLEGEPNGGRPQSRRFLDSVTCGDSRAAAGW
jgi:catechol 2,3-dioxygenase-like lactoylglutathione lyase family enzyme